jgi:hypothetical protein
MVRLSSLMKPLSLDLKSCTGYLKNPPAFITPKMVNRRRVEARDILTKFILMKVENLL